ncbi:hypothetical protein [Corynebacterium frankenforstense]
MAYITAVVVVLAVLEYRKLDREPSNVGLLEHRLHLAVIFVAGLLGSRAALVVPAAMLFCGTAVVKSVRRCTDALAAAQSFAQPEQAPQKPQDLQEPTER